MKLGNPTQKQLPINIPSSKSEFLAVMQELKWRDLASSGATLASGVTGGFVPGLLIAGVGGRLAMLVLRLTSSPSLHGAKTDDGFIIGRFSAETVFLLGVTAALGILGGLFYLIVRGWIPQRRRVVVMSVFFGLIAGSLILRPHGIDFTELSPLPLAVAMFVAIPVAYGAAMSWLTERMLRPDSVMRRRKWAWIAGLIPLVIGFVFGVVVLAIATLIWLFNRSVPSAVAAWKSPAAAWIGRGLMFLAAAAGGFKLVRDSIQILF